ncbi:phage head-tail connector protein [Spiroplasma sp. ChiS]
MDLLNFVKLSLRIQHNLFDEEIKTLIQSAKNILINSGLHSTKYY